MAYPKEGPARSGGDDPRAVVADDTPLRQFGDRLKRGLPALNALLAETAEMAGEPAVGSDPAGAVHVVFAPDGLPQSIQIDDHWRAAVGAEGLAMAITAACRAASAAQSEQAMTAMEQRRWSERVGELFDYLAGQQPPPPDLPRGSGGSLPAPPGHASSQILMSAFADEAPADPERALVVPDPASLDRTGIGAFGRLSITLSGLSVLTCEADAAWVSRQQTSDLNEAVAAALAALRANLAGGNDAGR